MIIAAAPHTDSAPPSVTLTVSAIPAPATTLTITRAVPGLPVAKVRGAEGATVIGAVFGVVDYETPFGVATLYRADAFDATGAVLATAQVSVTLAVDEMWISDPLSPVVSAPCRGVKSPESFATLTYSVTTAVTPTEGQELPVGLAGTRQAATGVPLVIIAGNAAEATPIRAVLRYATPFLLRCPVRWQVPLPSLAYCLASSVSDSLFGGMYGRSHLSATFDLVQAPGRSIAVPVRTYASLLGEASTYGDLSATYPTYLALLLGGG